MQQKYWLLLLGLSAVVVFTVFGGTNNNSAQKPGASLELEMSQLREENRTLHTQAKQREREKDFLTRKAKGLEAELEDAKKQQEQQKLSHQAALADLKIQSEREIKDFRRIEKRQQERLTMQQHATFSTRENNKAEIKGATTDQRERLPQSQPIDERMKLPHWRDWSDDERRVAIANAAITTISVVAHDFPAGYPGARLRFHEPVCGNHVRYANRAENSPAMIKWRDSPVTVLTAAAERLFQKRGRRLLNSLDVGPLHSPMLIPRCKAYFLDWEPLAKLRAHYTELENSWLTDPDYIGSAEELETVPDNSMDLVIMSHVLEHTRQPLRALRNALRVATKDAIIYIAMPDMCITFDGLRLLAPWSHHVEEWFDGRAADRNEFEHQREFSLSVSHMKGIRQRQRTNPRFIDVNAYKTNASRYSIHYHTWTPRSWDEFVNRALEELKFPAVVVQTGPHPRRRDSLYTILRRL